MSSSRAHSPVDESMREQSTKTWAQHLGDAISDRLRGLGRQVRNLHVQSGFTGLGSHVAGFTQAPLRLGFDDVAGADRKAEARTFLQDNVLMAEHFFEDVGSLSSGGPCLRCHRWCPPRLRPDLYFGGFPCQPFSPMRRRKAEVHIHAADHEEFEGAEKQIKHLRESQPAAALLENSTGAGEPCEFEGEITSGAQYLYERIKDLYVMAVVRLDFRVWVAISRPRLWIFLVRRDVGSQDIVDKAAEIAREIEEHRRAAGPPDAIVCSALVDSHTRNPVDSHTRNPLGARASGTDVAPADAKEPAWQTRCKAQRSKWKSLEWPFHDDHPLAAAEFAGMTCTPREREVLEVRLLQRCARFGLNPRDADELKLARRNFFVDYSQNVRSIARTVNRERSPIDLPVLSGLCTSFRVYSFEHDQRVSAKDFALSYGWSASVSTRSVEKHLEDLLGEAQALPCAATAQWALVLAVGRRFVGVWE